MAENVPNLAINAKTKVQEAHRSIIKFKPKRSVSRQKYFSRSSEQ
jgi:hypothetical protein